jgi:hypothetical protein
MSATSYVPDASFWSAGVGQEADFSSSRLRRRLALKETGSAVFEWESVEK